MFKAIFAALVAVSAVPALAQLSSQTFSGAFVGVQGGWQQDRLTSAGAAGLFATADNNPSGFTYGGQVGYDFRLSPKIVIGAEVALTGRTGAGTVSLFGTSYVLRQGRSVTATARLGILGTARDLFYVRGGFANAEYEYDSFGGRFTGNRDGFTLGGGYERMLTSRVSARIEYGYSGFASDKSFTGDEVSETEYSRNAVTAGVNFRF